MIHWSGQAVLVVLVFQPFVSVLASHVNDGAVACRVHPQHSRPSPSIGVRQKDVQKQKVPLNLSWRPLYLTWPDPCFHGERLASGDHTLFQKPDCLRWRLDLTDSENPNKKNLNSLLDFEILKNMWVKICIKSTPPSSNTMYSGHFSDKIRKSAIDTYNLHLSSWCIKI